MKDDGFSWNPGKIGMAVDLPLKDKEKRGCVIAAANLDVISEGWPETYSSVRYGALSE